MASAAAAVHHYREKENENTSRSASPSIAPRIGHSSNVIEDDEDGPKKALEDMTEQERRHAAAEQKRSNAVSFISIVKKSLNNTAMRKIYDTNDEEGRKNQAAWRIQLFARSHILCRARLNRQNLNDRLVYEQDLVVGAWRLFNQLMVFTFLMIAVGLSGDSPTKRGIYTNLDDAFGFEEIQGLTDRNHFVGEQLGAISSTAKEYFPLSTSKYFVRERGGMRLVKDVETFSSPKLLGGVQLNIQVPEFSFTAIVKTSIQFVGGYLLRKRMVSAGPGSELACWGWHLSAQSGPSLHYGSHDYFATDKSSSVKAGTQEQVGLEFATEFKAGESKLLTMVVRGDNVTFYSNLEELGSVLMARPITDCFNNLEGVLVGDSGVSMGQLSFIPKALSPTLIEEIYTSGGTLDDLSTGSSPTPLEQTQLEEKTQGLASSVDAVDKSVAQQQGMSEILTVIQDVGDTTSGSTLVKSPSHPTGRIAMNHTTQRDGVNPDREYYQMMLGPWLLNKAPAANGASFDGERYWHSDDFPSFANRGVSFTTWFRNVDCAEGASCGTFLMSAHTDKARSARCWSAWLETDGIYWDAPGGDPSFGYPVNGELSEHYSNQYKLRSDTWRHVAFVFNEDTDDVEFFLDGVRIFSRFFGKSVKDMDCGAVNVSVGFRWPGYTYGASVEYYDMRMYVGAPLTEDEVFNIATAPVPPSPSFGGDDQSRARQRCLYMSSPEMTDTTWIDAYGHGCDWYYSNKAEHPSICRYPGVGDECPIACKSKQQCFNIGTYNKYFAWNSIRRIEASTPNGTLCLGTNRSRSVGEPLNAANDSTIAHNAEVEEKRAACNAWMDQIDTDTRVWKWRKDVNERQPGTVRVNLTECQMLAEAVDPFCEFDLQQVADFTREMQANGGDFTLGFWVKPIGTQSLTPDGRFMPSVHFLTSVSPPFSHVAFGPFQSGNKGEVRTRTACVEDELGGRTEEIEFPSSASLTDWTFLAITKNNADFAKAASDPTSQGATATVSSNNGMLSENQGSWSMCVDDPDTPLFSAIEVNYPLLISPVMMVPRALPFGLIQEIYYDGVKPMGLRGGPLETNADRASTKIEVEKEDYVEKSALMATPIIFQKRVAPSDVCPFEYSTEWLSAQHEKVAEQCTAPLECSSDLVQNNKTAIMSCRGDAVERENVFGLEPQEFGGIGFADFLFSITDTPFVFRDGQLFPTSTFIDSLTQSVKIILVFFTPEYGLTTVLSFDADMSGATSVYVDVKVQHYAVLEGAQLIAYLVVQCLVLLFIVSMLVDMGVNIKGFITTYREDKTTPSVTSVALIAVDLLSIALTVIVVCVRIPAKLGSANVVREILGNLNGIPWASSTTSVGEKKEAFFKNVQGLLTLIEQEGTVDSFLNVVLIVLLIRVIQCTSLHPRLALLTGTVSKAMDDFWHSTLLIILIMGSFAGIGTWRFGSEKADFATWEVTMQTQFFMMLGDFGGVEDWAEEADLAAFVVLYVIVMFLLVLNFLLAIIVEAYMQVRTLNEENEIELEFVTDMACMSTFLTLKAKHQWPSVALLTTLLKDVKKHNIGYMDLWNTGVFKDQAGLSVFVDYYSGFECMEPVELTSHGMRVATDDNEKQIAEIERRVANLLGMRMPTLLEQAQLGLQALLPANVVVKGASSTPSLTSPTKVTGRLLSPVALEPQAGKAFSFDDIQAFVDFHRSKQSPSHGQAAQSAASTVNRDQLGGLSVKKLKPMPLSAKKKKRSKSREKEPGNGDSGGARSNGFQNGDGPPTPAK